MRKLLPFLIILLSLPVVWPFFQKGFFWTHDIIFLTRIYAAAQALADGQFPLRWIPDFRYGEPLFNYYAPLPYYFGALVHFLGFDFLTTAKIIFILITLVSGLSMYLLAKEYWGSWGGLLSALLYLYAPYQAVNLYIRGALSETFAFVWFPLIFWAYHRLFKTGQKKYLLLSAVFLALLILTHNISSLIFLPFLFAFIIFLIWTTKKISLLLSVFGSLLWGLGLSAFFWLPALVEKKFVQTQKTILALENFVNQFVKPEEFLKPAWDGFSISPELGIIHLLLVVLTIFSALIFWRKQKSVSLFIFFGLLLLFFSLGMQTSYSLKLWLFLSPLQFIQFPWRFAGISLFFLALLGGSSVQLIKSEKIQTFLVVLTVLTLLSVQGYYFQPQNLRPKATDKDFIILEEAYLPKEYLPLGVKENPPQKIKTPVLAESYQPIPINNLVKRSNSYTFNIKLSQSQDILVPIYWFPGWKAFQEKEEIVLKKQPKTGLIFFSLPPGKQEVRLKFTDTPIRQISNLVSLTSLIVIFFAFLANFRKQPSLT